MPNRAFRAHETFIVNWSHVTWRPDGKCIYMSHIIYIKIASQRFHEFLGLKKPPSYKKLGLLDELQ